MGKISPFLWPHIRKRVDHNNICGSLLEEYNESTHQIVEIIEA